MGSCVLRERAAWSETPIRILNEVGPGSTFRLTSHLHAALGCLEEAAQQHGRNNRILRIACSPQATHDRMKMRSRDAGARVHSRKPMSTAAKSRARVGPRYPHLVVLVGATGDLARRKLLPGLFHLSSAGFIPGCRIRRSLAGRPRRGRLPQGGTQRSRRVRHPEGDGRGLDFLCREAGLCTADGGRRGAESGGGQGGADVWRRESPAALSQRAAQRGAVGGTDARRSEPRRARSNRHGKAVRHRFVERRVAEREPARGVQGAADLPHRPLSRQGTGTEHPRVPLRQRALRADLESQLHRPRAD